MCFSPLLQLVNVINIENMVAVFFIKYNKLIITIFSACTHNLHYTYPNEMPYFT